MTITSPPQVDYRQDITIWPVLQNLVNCLCIELATSGLPELCFCGLLVGASATDQMGDGALGQAWVRLVTAYPSTAFPTQTTIARGSCSASLAAEVEIGVLRCAPTSSDGSEPPSESDWWESGRLQMADMAAVRRAIRCCDSGAELVVLGSYTPTGPQGGTVGGVWQVFVAEQLPGGPGTGSGRRR